MASYSSCDSATSQSPDSCWNGAWCLSSCWPTACYIAYSRGPGRATEDLIHHQLFSGFHSADPPLGLQRHDGLVWMKPSRSQTERFLFTFGNNLKPLEKIMFQLRINSFTTRYKGRHNSGAYVWLNSSVSILQLEREESLWWQTVDMRQLLFLGRRRGGPVASQPQSQAP